MHEHRFVFGGLPSRVVFGAGSLQDLGQEVESLGATRALVLATPNQEALAQDVSLRLGSRSVGVYAQAIMHVPIDSVTRALEEVRRCGADCLLAAGGGSTIGLAKAIALESGLPIVAIPTTYAGSEMTSIYGITEAARKRTGKDARVLPRTVIYDVNLTLSLPVSVSVTSAMNAVAHAAEGLYAQHSNPVISMMAEQGIEAIARAIPALYRDPLDVGARSFAQYGAWLCGTVLGNVGMALHHKLCHVLGGSFNLPHAEVHSVVLPHALAFNSNAAPSSMEQIADSLGVSYAPAGMFDLATRHGAPSGLKDIGMRESDLDLAADLVVSQPYWNPRPVGVGQRDEIRTLLQHAFNGVRPEAMAEGFAPGRGGSA
ncbi:Maleylacetate reductase [Achromobacter animicus]|uniref:maleylacetate reductase n=1 Tax=Achromobacter animicus TaxID=1389935 RepID=UPI00146610DE|nr:maleylacetate reductase [Achromobacter animicus]CAB3863452.1 Maleylacetate reductase [Achromobacter animicus]